MILFIDTSAFLALNNRKDKNHNKAVGYIKTLLGQTVKITTSYLVIAETATILKQKFGHAKALNFLHFFEKEGIEILNNNEVIRHKAKEMFKTNSEKGITFLHCINVATMKYYGINRMVTFDTKIKDLGVIVVPKG